jgi:uridine kinase
MDLSSRKKILEIVGQHILGLNLNRPLRVCVDGVTAAGKSTFARDLAQVLSTSHREIVSTTLDGFHNPRSRRYEKGRGSPEGYYYDAYNYAGIIEFLLKPLGPDGDRQYRTQIFDLDSDRSVEVQPRAAADRSILIVDGSFALRGELLEYWDLGIYLSVDENIAVERASVRDGHLFGSEEKARLVTQNRYHAAHRIHFEIARPTNAADFVICNNDPANPVILIQRDRRDVEGLSAEG